PGGYPTVSLAGGRGQAFRFRRGLRRSEASALLCCLVSSASSSYRERCPPSSSACSYRSIAALSGASSFSSRPPSSGRHPARSACSDRSIAALSRASSFLHSGQSPALTVTFLFAFLRRETAFHMADLRTAAGEHPTALAISGLLAPLFFDRYSSTLTSTWSAGMEPRCFRPGPLAAPSGRSRAVPGWARRRFMRSRAPPTRASRLFDKATRR